MPPLPPTMLLPRSLEEEVDRSFAPCVLRKKGGSGGNVRRPQLPDMGTARTGLRFMLELHCIFEVELACVELVCLFTLIVLARNFFNYYTL